MRELPVNLPELRGLYQRLGGEARVHAILRRFYQKMSEDVLIGFFFDGKDLDLISERQALFLLRAMGARPTYSGKPPAQAHDDLAPILRGHFDRRLRILEEVLRSEGLGEMDIRTWIAFENAFRDSIVKD